MTMMSLEQAQHELPELLSRVAKGEIIVLERQGLPVGRLCPVTVEIPEKRKLGFLEGKIKVPDDFNEMMPDQIEEMFYGKP